MVEVAVYQTIADKLHKLQNNVLTEYDDGENKITIQDIFKLFSIILENKYFDDYKQKGCF